MLNVHKPRDRTHFEQFGQFHRSFYRAVEATSVTPWASRALDRALGGDCRGGTRHIYPGLTREAAVKELMNQPAMRAVVRDAIVARAPPSAILGGNAALSALIDDSVRCMDCDRGRADHGWQHLRLRRGEVRLAAAPYALGTRDRQSVRGPQRFIAGRSMRDVEANVPLTCVIQGRRHRQRG